MRVLTEQETKNLGSIVCIGDGTPGEEKHLSACWAGPIWRVCPEGITWDQVKAQFFAHRTINPELTDEWENPDFSKWVMHKLDPDEEPKQIYFYCFVPHDAEDKE